MSRQKIKIQHVPALILNVSSLHSIHPTRHSAHSIHALVLQLLQLAQFQLFLINYLIRKSGLNFHLKAMICLILKTIKQQDGLLLIMQFLTLFMLCQPPPNIPQHVTNMLKHVFLVQMNLTKRLSDSHESNATLLKPGLTPSEQRLLTP